MTLPRRDAFYVSTDDLAEQVYCEQRGFLRATASERTLRDEFRGDKGEEAAPRNEPEEITLFPEETGALRAIGVALGARTWREIFVAPPKLLSLGAFAKAAKKAKVAPELAKALAEKLSAARKADAFHLRLVEENPTLFRLHDEASSGSRAARAQLESILAAADRRPHRGVFKFRLLRVAAAAEIARGVVVETRTAPDARAAEAMADVVRARANLGAYLFKRARWRMEIKVAGGDEALTDGAPKKNDLALGLMKRLIAFLRKEAEPEAPPPAHCPPCEFKTRCSIYKRMKRWRYRGGRPPVDGAWKEPT